MTMKILMLATASAMALAKVSVAGAATPNGKSHKAAKSAKAHADLESAESQAEPVGYEFQSDLSKIEPAQNYIYSKEEYERQLSMANERGTRDVASSSNYESAMSAPLKELRTSILRVQNSEQLTSLLDDLSTRLEAIDKSDATAGISAQNQYRGEDRDFRYFAAQIEPLKCLRGIVWRFTPLAESAPLVDNRLVSAVYGLGTSMQILSPQIADLESASDRDAAATRGEHNIDAAVFDYITKPFDGAVLFTSGRQLQDHLMNQCYKALGKSYQRVRRLDLSTPIVWDNKMFFGVGSFPDDLDRYRLIGEAERHFSMAMKHMGMHFIAFFRAYSITNYFNLISDTGFEFFKGSMAAMVPGLGNGYRDITPLTLRTRTEVVRRPKFAKTFVLNEDGNVALSTLAWPNFVASVQELNLTWAEIKGKPANVRRVLNPAFLNGFTRGTDNSLQTWTRLTEGRTALHSRVTNRTEMMDLRNFYVNPIHDLKTLLPTSFDDGPRFLKNDKKTFVLDSKTQAQVPAPSRYSMYRNWYAGEPTGWNVNTWGTIFPEMKNPGDLPEILRTVNQEWGGILAALPVIQFIR